MRVLGTAVLTFEWIVLALGIPVATNVADVTAGAAWGAFAAISVLVVAAIATLTRPVGRWLGWAVQVAVISCGLLVPMLAILGAIFAGLWFAAIHWGTKVDRIRADRSAGEAPAA